MFQYVLNVREMENIKKTQIQNIKKTQIQLQCVRWKRQMALMGD